MSSTLYKSLANGLLFVDGEGVESSSQFSLLGGWGWRVWLILTTLLFFVEFLLNLLATAWKGRLTLHRSLGMPVVRWITKHNFKKLNSPPREIVLTRKQNLCTCIRKEGKVDDETGNFHCLKRKRDDTRSPPTYLLLNSCGLSTRRHSQLTKHTFCYRFLGASKTAYNFSRTRGSVNNNS